MLLGLSDEEKMELESSLRKPEETELEYFERRYKERVSNNFWKKSIALIIKIIQYKAINICKQHTFIIISFLDNHCWAFFIIVTKLLFILIVFYYCESFTLLQKFLSQNSCNLPLIKYNDIVFFKESFTVIN